jgi:hypothetical protein
VSNLILSALVSRLSNEYVQCSSKHFIYRITVAADRQIRVSDITLPLSSSAQDTVETLYTMKQSVKKVLRCHSDRVKRIVTEDSPALFLTVAEVCLDLNMW